MGCLVGLPFLRCLTKEIFMKSGRNMVCSYYCKFVVEMDNTTTDKRATGSLDRMGTLVVRKRNSCCACMDYLHCNSCW